MDSGRTRGDLIRHRLKTGQEDPAHWAKLESLVKQLTLRKDAKSGLIEFV